MTPAPICAVRAQLLRDYQATATMYANSVREFTDSALKGGAFKEMARVLPRIGARQTKLFPQRGDDKTI
jgi:hypothetical protein